ncbi:MAG: Ig-like domain-containing protein, partial [Oscillospiraceae bacterium]|nr:Ig-like domain-containing protein [Oscillospiraceae bacterium]
GNKWQYWNHGDFAKSIYLNDKSNGVEVKDSFWKSSKHDGYDLELLENVTSDITGEPTNIVKLNFKENSIRIQAYKQPYYTNSDHRGFVDAAANKLYEFTGYVKSENTRSLPRLKLSTYYYNDTSKESTSVDSLSVLPWEGLSGDQAWTKFTVGSLYLNYGYGEEYGLEPRVDISNTNANGAEISLAHFEVREVAFDRAELSFAEEKNTYACGDTLTTELVLYSNTGNVITPGEALGPGEVTYSSSDPSVATVDETGVITVIKNGECEITATVTINGITRESTAPLSVSGVEKALNKAVASISKSALSKGETAEVSYELFDNEENLYTDKGVVYYESTDVSVAAVSQEGVVTAKAAGKTDIIVWVQSEGKLIRGAVSVTVTDDTLLASAQIRGKNIVEAGFSEKLYVRAWHESGKEAYLDACNVSFALKDNADAAILTVDENGTVSAISAGKATVIATVTGAQNSVTGELEIEVVPTSPKSKTIYFSKPGEGYALDVTMDDYGWEVNRELSSTSVGMVKSSAFTCRSTCIQSNINAVGNTRNADTAIDIWVDYDGWYDIDFLGVIYYRGPKRANLYMDGNYLGDFEFYTTFTTSRNFTELKSLNSMYLTKGKHTFIIRSMEKNPENSYAWHTPSAIMLKYVETPATIENVNVSVSDNELAVGESSAVSYETVMPNGRNYTFGKKHGNVADDANN